MGCGGSVEVDVQSGYQRANNGNHSGQNGLYVQGYVQHPNPPPVVNPEQQETKPSNTEHQTTNDIGDAEQDVIAESRSEAVSAEPESRDADEQNLAASRNEDEQDVPVSHDNDEHKEVVASDEGEQKVEASRDSDEQVAEALGDNTPEDAVIREPPEADRPSEARRNVSRWRKRLIAQSKHPFRLDDTKRFDFIKVETNDSNFRMGRNTVTLDTRLHKDDEVRTRPTVEPGTLWEDPDFSEEVAFAGLEERVFYMRPKEICKKPALFTDGTTRFDIEQGHVGTCYFLSVVASLAENKEILDQVFVSRNYDPESETYDGVLHVRFWKFGKWIDVFIDDRIPVYKFGDENQIWASKSHDPNELWVTLLEKAYTKEFGGSYKGISAGIVSESFANLTGGISERFVHASDLEDVSSSEFFARITVALKNGSLVTCSTMVGDEEGNGLVSGHYYTITGSALVDLKGNSVELLRIRNPWGSGEWKGAWSDNSKEWKMVEDTVKDTLKVRGKVDGEFWMTMEDFLDKYEDSNICNLTPDFDGDGKADDLDKVCSILSEWRGESAAGSDTRKFDNPKFEFVVPQGVDSAQVLIQIIQKEVPDDEEQPFVRVDLFLTETVLSNGFTVYDELTNMMSFRNSKVQSYRYNLKPGRYLILPTTIEEGIEAEFIIRTFSALPLNCRELTETPRHLVRKSDLQFECDKTVYETPKLEYISAAWNENNAGGQISNDSFHKNPQYLLNISGPDPVPLTILLLQETSSELAFGFKLWEKGDQSLPLDIQSIYSCYDSAISTTDGSGVFLFGAEAEGTFLVPPGDYILLAFTDEADSYEEFVVCLATSEACQISHEAYNQ